MDKARATQYLKALEDYARQLLIDKDVDIQTLITGIIVILKEVIMDEVQKGVENNTPYI